jgi:two-component system cell cycle response regulator
MYPPAEILSGLLAQAVDQSPDGITIADARKPDMPLVYVNAGFEKMTGYSSAEILGKNCRFLQGKETTQHAVDVVRECIKNGESCIVILQNFRKDGTLFWNEFNISPVRDAGGVVTHFIGVQKANQQLSVLALTDGLTGIGNRRHFNDRLQAMLSMAQRNKESLSVLMIDLDYFKRFNDRYGHQAGDDSLIAVGGIIADAFKRPSDCVGRYGGEEFAVVSLAMSTEELQQHAQLVCEKVCASNIPHSDSPHHVVTISVGGVSRVPERDTPASSLLKSADGALYAAKQQGRNRVHIVR